MADPGGWNFVDGDELTPELTVIRLLGGGEHYEAYLAFDEVTLGPVVVKVLRPSRVGDPASRRGLEREVGLLASVNHPVVVRGLRASLDGARPHVVMEAIDGPRLSTLVRRYGVLPEQQYLPLAIDLASALHYLRGLGVVHLDIKPGNIIMGAPARLIDLSVARSVAEAGDLTGPVGTDGYMAPEQLEPLRYGAPGPAADVYALGVTLHHAITGHPPEVDGDLASLEERTTPDVVKVLASCLSRDPADRPLPHEVAAGLAPALERVPRGRLAGLRVR